MEFSVTEPYVILVFTRNTRVLFISTRLNVKCLNTIWFFHEHEECHLPPHKSCRLASVQLSEPSPIVPEWKVLYIIWLAVSASYFQQLFGIYPFNFPSGTSAFPWSHTRQYQCCSSRGLLTKEQKQELTVSLTSWLCSPLLSIHRMQCWDPSPDKYPSKIPLT